MSSVQLIDKHTEAVKAKSYELGFSFCGIAPCEALHSEAPKLENWLKANRHASMSYMEKYFDERINPKLLVPNAQSVITLMCNYFPEQIPSSSELKISKYAYGTDYHFVIREKLNNLLAFIKQEIGDVQGRGFVDSAPVLERAWAVKSGLGWVGKNGNLISKQQGSFFFIATLIVDVQLNYDAPYIKDYCGTCTACIDSCPTEAILPNKVVDGSKCISYFTIELKEALMPNNINANTFDNWLFGCDTCQDVCPWNKFSKANQEPHFKPITEIFEFNTKDWLQLSKENFNKIFKNSPLKRTKFEGLQRNLKFLLTSKY